MWVIRVAKTWPMTVSAMPRSSPTRSIKAASKSSSPFMARAVISATRAPTPASSASSSIHSCWIIVLSISASSMVFRRPISGWHTRSTPISCTSAQTSHRFTGLVSTANSAASSAASHCADWPPHALRRLSTKAGCNFPGLAIRVITNMKWSSGWGQEPCLRSNHKPICLNFSTFQVSLVFSIPHPPLSDHPHDQDVDRLSDRLMFLFCGVQDLQEVFLRQMEWIAFHGRRVGGCRCNLWIVKR